MMSAWKKSYNANIVIYFDAPNAAPELYTFRFKGKEVEKQVLKTYEEMDSADPEVLKKILNEMQDLYPSDSYGLILGSSCFMDGFLQGDLVGVIGCYMQSRC